MFNERPTRSTSRRRCGQGAHQLGHQLRHRTTSNLTYKVYRNYTSINNTPICTIESSNVFWDVKTLGCYDTGRTPGATYKYRVIAFDDFGNLRSGSDTSVTIADGAAGPSVYGDGVRSDHPDSYYRLDETSGTAVYDSIGFNDYVAGSGVTRGAAGALTNEADTASTFDGTSSGTVSGTSPIPGPDTFTTEAWFKTTSNSGGKIIGFGGNSTGDSTSYDRHVYMDNAGHIYFGVYTGQTQTLNTSKSYNDGQWHLVTASMSSAGMRLSVDGKLAGSRSDTTTGQVYNGYWRVGGDNLGGWPSQPSSNYFAGSIDEVAIYPTALTTQQVAAHYQASGRANPLPQAPADAYGAAVFNLEPDLYWRLGDASGSTAKDSGVAENDGNIQGGVTLGATGAVSGTSNKAATFNGSDGAVVASSAANNPTVYTETTWFKTTTTNGGKLMGFGNAASGLSGGYDRHIYMEGSGQLTFGTWTGQTNTTTSPLAYNDGNWHFMAATQSSDGLKLYVDGALVGTNAQTQAQDYTGYWRIGGDTTWGPQPWFAGTLDEAAVFSKALTAGQISQLYALGAGVNVAPTADFSSTVAKLKVSFDASASADSDGTIAGSDYVWDFGDGSTGTGKTPEHTYTNAQAYDVKLTVTDNGGKSTSVTKSVTTVSTPTAVITASDPVKLKVDVDGTDSTDAGSTITGYEWDFGDGTPVDTAMNPAAHTYATAGDKTITLKVTDASGNADTATKTITVVGNVAPTASFTSSANKLKLTFAGSGTDSDGTISSYAWDFGDSTSSTEKNPPVHTYAAAGDYVVTLTVTDNDGATDTDTQTLHVSQNVSPTAAFTATVDHKDVSFDASASTDSDGTIAGPDYVWDFGDGSTGSGKTATHTYAAADTYTVKLTVTDNDGGTGSISKTFTTSLPPANVKPTAVIGEFRQQPGGVVHGLRVERFGRDDHRLRVELRRRGHEHGHQPEPHVHDGRALHGDPQGHRQRWTDRHGDQERHRDGRSAGQRQPRGRPVRSYRGHRVRHGRHRRCVDGRGLGGELLGRWRYREDQDRCRRIWSGRLPELRVLHGLRRDSRRLAGQGSQRWRRVRGDRRSWHQHERLPRQGQDRRQRCPDALRHEGGGGCRDERADRHF